MSVLTSRTRGSQGQVAVSATGQREPIEPAYTKPNTASRPWSNNRIPSEPTEWKAPVVHGGMRRAGMRYLYAYGAVEQPLNPLGTGPDTGIGVWSSEFQPDFSGKIYDAGFNDALFQAGYPGFNLGLSFKVAQLQQQVTGPGMNMRMSSPNVRVTITRLNRSSATPSVRG